jgi:hypothetical protein
VTFWEKSRLFLGDFCPKRSIVFENQFELFKILEYNDQRKSLRLYTQRTSKFGNLTRRHFEFNPGEAGVEAAQQELC